MTESANVVGQLLASFLQPQKITQMRRKLEPLGLDKLNQLIRMPIGKKMKMLIEMRSQSFILIDFLVI